MAVRFVAMQLVAAQLLDAPDEHPSRGSRMIQAAHVKDSSMDDLRGGCEQLHQQEERQQQRASSAPKALRSVQDWHLLQ